VLDYCAGTGGKSLALAAMAGVEVTVHDIDLSRLETLERRASASGVRVARLPPGSGRLFDSVLVDAPCSGLGAVRRNPEVRWQVGEGESRRFAGRQLAILREAARHVLPGGCLIYGVCTFMPDETERIAEDFLSSARGFTASVPPDWAAPLLLAGRRGHWTWPTLWGADVFFIAGFVRHG
jgi:16S rRNA (cytosine967-C5)-methyltransferase